MTCRCRRFAAAALAVALTAPGVLSRRRSRGPRWLPPGAHGIHLHAVGACTPDFKAATGHINPDGVPHGLRHPDGPDHGDLPTLYVAADGSARVEFFTVLASVCRRRHAGAAGRGRLDGDHPRTPMTT